jgi:hypothetical protein
VNYRPSAARRPMKPSGNIGTRRTASPLSAAKEFYMRIIFVVLIGSILSIALLKYSDQTLGGNAIYATPAEMSAVN